MTAPSNATGDAQSQASSTSQQQAKGAAQQAEAKLAEVKDEFHGSHLLNGVRDEQKLGASLRNYPHFEGLALGWDSVPVKTHRVQIGSRNFELSSGQVALRAFKEALKNPFARPGESNYPDGPANPDSLLPVKLSSLAIRANGQIWRELRNLEMSPNEGTGVSAALFKIDHKYHQNGDRSGNLEFMLWGGTGIVIEYYGAPTLTLVSSVKMIANGAAEFGYVCDPSMASPTQRVTDPEKIAGIIHMTAPLAIVKSVYAVSRSLITEEEKQNPDLLGARLVGFKSGALEYKLPVRTDSDGKVIILGGPRMTWTDQFTRDSLEKNGSQSRETLLTGVELLNNRAG